MMHSEPKQILIVRKDLNMRKGKIALAMFVLNCGFSHLAHAKLPNYTTAYCYNDGIGHLCIRHIRQLSSGVFNMEQEETTNGYNPYRSTTAVQYDCITKMHKFDDTDWMMNDTNMVGWVGETPAQHISKILCD